MAAKFTRSTDVQTVMLPRDRYTPSQARAWLKRAGFKISGKEPEGKSSKYLHYRQHDPKDYAPGTFRTIELGDGVKATVAIPERKAVGWGKGSGIYGGYGTRGPERAGGPRRRAARSAAGRMNPAVSQEVLDAPVGTILVHPYRYGSQTEYEFYVVTAPGKMAQMPSDAGRIEWKIATHREDPLWVAKLGRGKLTSNATYGKHAADWRNKTREAQRAAGRMNPRAIPMALLGRRFERGYLKNDIPGFGAAGDRVVLRTHWEPQMQKLGGAVMVNEANGRAFEVERSEGRRMLTPQPSRNPGKLRRNHDKATAEAMLRAAARVAGTPGRSPIFYARAEGRMAALAEDSVIPGSMRRDAAEYRSALFNLSSGAHYDERQRMLRWPRGNPGKRRNPAQGASYVDELISAAEPGDSLNLPCPTPPGGTYGYFHRVPGGWRFGGRMKKVSERLIREIAEDFLAHDWVFTLVHGGASRKACR